MSITFDVIGVPVAQGSMKALGRGASGRTILTHSNHANLMPWRQQVAHTALEARPTDWPLDTPVAITLTFRFPRPAGHYRKNGTLKPSAPTAKTSKPDLDKLQRSILDGLATILYRGDQQVISIIASKRYTIGAEVPGVLITVTPHLPTLTTAATSS